jgi:hypothetical protein
LRGVVLDFIFEFLIAGESAKNSCHLPIRKRNRQGELLTS